MIRFPKTTGDISQCVQTTSISCLAVLILVASNSTSAAVRSKLSGTMVPESSEEARSIIHVDKETGYEFPFSVGGAYFFQTKQVYEGAGMGYSLTFASMPGTYVSVYLYDNSVENIEDGCHGDQVRREMESSVAGIIRHNKSLGVDHEFKHPPNVLPGFVQSYSTYSQENVDVKSYILLRGHQGRFLKIRVTSTSGGMEGRLPFFLSHLKEIVGLSKDTTCRPEPPVEQLQRSQGNAHAAYSRDTATLFEHGALPRL